MPDLRQFLLNTFLPAVCVLGIIYNCLIAINGDEGIRARELVQEKLTEKEAELAELKTYRGKLENRAKLLTFEHLDADLLDETARQMLGYAREGEQVLPAGELDRFLREKRNSSRPTSD